MDDRVPLPAAAQSALMDQLRRLRTAIPGALDGVSAGAITGVRPWPLPQTQGVAP